VRLPPPREAADALLLLSGMKLKEFCWVSVRSLSKAAGGAGRFAGAVVNEICGSESME
jgi:hypothetical protein